MTNCVRSPYFYKNRKQARERQLHRLAMMRAAKERKRIANPAEREPKFVRLYPLEFSIRDKRNGEQSRWYDLKSGRDLSKRIAVLLRYYETAH